jgi:hypothetical protein
MSVKRNDTDSSDEHSVIENGSVVNRHVLPTQNASIAMGIDMGGCTQNGQSANQKKPSSMTFHGIFLSATRLSWDDLSPHQARLQEFQFHEPGRCC